MIVYFSKVGRYKAVLTEVLEAALEKLGQPSEDLEMSLSFVSAEEIKELNNNYRSVDSVTDVLSFPTTDLQREVVDIENFRYDNINPETECLNLGDVVICLERAESQAEEYGHSLQREICFLALHGLLHLLGYDHIEPFDEQQMISLQEEILQSVDITR